MQSPPTPATPVRDRVRELRRVRADRLRPHPLNWRKHPAAQRAAFSAVLAEIGYAGALLARECPDGTLELIDGHLRAETTPDAEVPVLVVDLTADEAALLLSVHDPLAGMAETDGDLLRRLTADMEVRPAELRTLIDATLEHLPVPPSDAKSHGTAPILPTTWRDQLQVIVDCRDEAEQRALYERLTAAGHACRLSVL